jgi:putative heme degradation protein
MTTTFAPSPTEASLRLEDPNKLLGDWEALKATRHHLHNPEAARLLGVPEAALIASRLGSGAIRLPPDPFLILKGISKWHRVLVAVHNNLGVSLAIGKVEQVEQDGDAIRLTGAHLKTEFSASSVANAFWFIDVDEGHGRTRSLQFSDAAGDDIIKIFVFHKTAAAIAERGFKELAETIDQAPFVGAKVELSPSVFSPTTHRVGALEPISTPAPQAFETTFAALEKSTDEVVIETFAARASQRFTGRITHARIDPFMTHLHEQDIRMHLRPTALTSAAVLKEQGHITAFEFHDAYGLALRLSGNDQNQAFKNWAAQVWEGVS